jgi:hypothetical protein
MATPTTTPTTCTTYCISKAPPTLEQYHQLITEKQLLNKDKFLYTFGTYSEGFGKPSWNLSHIFVMDANLTWEDARYLIEKKNGVFNLRNTKQNIVGTYFEGYLWLPEYTNWKKQATLLARNHMMKNHDLLIIVRKPLDPGTPNYIPPRFRALEEKEQNATHPAPKTLFPSATNYISHSPTITTTATTPTTYIPHSTTTLHTFQSNMTEEEKIDHLMSQTLLCTKKIASAQTLAPSCKKIKTSQFHASDIAREPTLLKPPPAYYTCHRCGIGGHWKHLCPTLNDHTFVPLTYYQPPVGIPRSMLREARKDEDLTFAMRTEDGRYVVRQQYKDK